MASSILKYSTSMVFMFSTIYTLGFYYYASTGDAYTFTGMGDTTGEMVSEMPTNVLLQYIIDFLLEILSWASPFAIVKGLLYAMLPTPLYEPLNLLLFRPIGWIGTWITTEWVINKIRGSSES